MINVNLVHVLVVQILTLATLTQQFLKMMVHVNIVVVPENFPKATVTVMGINLMSVEFVEVKE